MQRSAASLRSLQAELRLEECAIAELAGVQREQQRRVAIWALLVDATDLQAAWSEPLVDEQSHSRREGTGGDSRESELLPLEDRLEVLLRGGPSDAVLEAALTMVYRCKSLASASG